MGKNKEYDAQNRDETVKNSAQRFLYDFISGVCIGIAFIIPGFSGGTVAVLLGIYERLLDSVVEFFKDIKKSILVLLPIGLGLISAAAILIFPLLSVLERFPLPTVSLFVGLALGGIPPLWKRISSRPSRTELSAFLVSITAVLILGILPVGNSLSVDLFSLRWDGYVLLFLVSALAACALVVPGISGSMIMLMFGYYNPILHLITDNLFHLKNLFDCVIILGICASGIGVGFLLASAIMKRLIAKYPRLTYSAIIGYIIGSMPAVYIAAMKSSGILTDGFKLAYNPFSPLRIAICLFMAVLGICISITVTELSKKKYDTESV